MKILLAEYTVFHDPMLAPEGRAMLDALRGSFKRCGHEVVTPEGVNFERELSNLAGTCDAGLVIAPDHLLAHFTKILEDATHNIGCGSMNCAVCANKKLTAAILKRNGILVPEEIVAGEKVIKEICGCGAQNMRLSQDIPGEGEFGQQYIPGEHLSVSLVCSRIVGNTCETGSGIPPLPLTINRQYIEIDDSTFRFLGGETPLNHPRSEEIIETASKAAMLLGCQGYAGVDMVVADDIYVVDVNPRITTSIVGIVQVMEEEIADLLLEASRGNLPRGVHCTGHVRFDKDGRVFAL